MLIKNFIFANGFYLSIGHTKTLSTEGTVGLGQETRQALIFS